jgi:hypothetical protein
MYTIHILNWLDGRVVMQRPAKPFTPVRFRLQPPFKKKYNYYVYSYARVVELVDTRDLKSLASNGVPVQVRLRVPVLGYYFHI